MQLDNHTIYSNIILHLYNHCIHKASTHTFIQTCTYIYTYIRYIHHIHVYTSRYIRHMHIHLHKLIIITIIMHTFTKKRYTHAQYIDLYIHTYSIHLQYTFTQTWCKFTKKRYTPIYTRTCSIYMHTYSIQLHKRGVHIRTHAHTLTVYTSYTCNFEISYTYFAVVLNIDLSVKHRIYLKRHSRGRDRISGFI